MPRVREHDRDREVRVARHPGRARRRTAPPPRAARAGRSDRPGPPSPGTRSSPRGRPTRDAAPSSARAPVSTPARPSVTSVRNRGEAVLTRWGILSTANINRHVLEGARLSDRVEVVAVGSRDRARAEAVCARARDPARARLVRRAPRRRRRRSRVHLASELPPSRVDAPRARCGQARALREALHAALGGGRRGVRPCGAQWARPVGGVHVASQPADGPLRRASARDRRAADDPSDVRLPSTRGEKRTPERGARRRSADGRRLLLRQRRQAARRGARARARRTGRRAERCRRALHGHAALSARRRRRVLLRVHVRPRGPGGDRQRGNALRRRSMALQGRTDPRSTAARNALRRRTRTSSSSRTSATRSTAKRRSSSAAKTQARKPERSKRSTPPRTSRTRRGRA